MKNECMFYEKTSFRLQCSAPDKKYHEFLKCSLKNNMNAKQLFDKNIIESNLNVYNYFFQNKFTNLSMVKHKIHSYHFNPEINKLQSRTYPMK